MSVVWAAGCVGEAPSLPASECGNAQVDPWEACDGTDRLGVSCEDLGLGDGVLQCVGCQLDASSCGPPPGMVAIPSGVFEMGSDAHDPDEQPVRDVLVSRFWMDQTEVTVADYEACVADDGACTEPLVGEPCNWAVDGREHHPVNCVSWSQAEAYCEWVGDGAARLPTEAEWEKAARGTNAWDYPWGNTPAPSCERGVMSDDDAGGDGCGNDSTMIVGSTPEGDSPYGVHDMAGNVSEWVSDWYADAYDPAGTYNPQGPDVGTAHVLRGGSWISSALRATDRTPEPVINYASVGFRCAMTPPRSL